MNSKIHNHSKEGAALLVVLGVLLILPLIVMSIAFDAKLEAQLISYKKKKLKAETLAYSGIEYAKAILAQQSQVSETDVEELGQEDRDGFMQMALYAQRGLSTSSTIYPGDSTNEMFTITIESAESGRNVNLLTRDQWMDIFEMANVPSTQWEELIDCLTDWIDDNDLHELNGAESDDEFYEEQGYPVKNSQLDSVEELLLIKGWTPEILYGSSAEDGSDEVFGIADILTVWGDGKVNINTAPTNTLLSFPEYEDWQLEDIMLARAGLDGEEGTLDDGIQSLNEVSADTTNFKLESNYIKVTSIGESSKTKYQVTAVFLLGTGESTVLYWNEGPVN
ncbi:MAG: general secretion pathway protein GspK [Pontiellaceae bacterium]|nr:general secretion pathway protein GspK [Pontiellaceae bacterium]